MEKDREQSRKLARRIRAEARKCFANCWRAVEGLDRYADAVYVEGLAVNQKYWMPFEHAWLEHAGVILDPTLPDPALAYFPGLRFAGREGLAEAADLPGKLECGCSLPVFFRFGFGGYDSPAFRAAREATERYAGINPREEAR